METKENTDTEALFMQIDKDLADRIRIYLTECNIQLKDNFTKKKLIEESVHAYMLKHPSHELSHENAN